MDIKFIIREEINNSILEKEIIEESFKEWVVAGLMTLASLGGVKAQNVDNITQKHIKSAELVQNKLQSGDEDVLTYFTKAGIKTNKENLDKLKNTKIKKDTEVDSTEANNTSSLRSKLNQGYVVSSVDIKSDTIYPNTTSVNLYVQDTIPFDFNSDNMFVTGGFDINNETKQELQSAVSDMKQEGVRIIGIKIISSTDTEPIKMGNDKLAQLRAESVQLYLKQLGVDIQMDINTKPNQGPNVYTNGMSSQERIQTRSETQEYRFVNVSFIVVVDVIINSDGKTSYPPQIQKKVTYKLVKLKNISKSGGHYKFRFKIPKPKIKKCSAKTKDSKGRVNITKCTYFDMAQDPY